MRVFLGSLLADRDGPQYLITVHDDDTVTSATRATSEPGGHWTEPVLIGAVR